MQGILCGKGQCREVLITDKQGGGQEEVFKCIGCGRTAPGRAVDGTGPRDVEQQATKLWNHALLTLRQKVSCAVSSGIVCSEPWDASGRINIASVVQCSKHLHLVFADYASGQARCGCNCIVQEQHGHAKVLGLR